MKFLVALFVVLALASEALATWKPNRRQRGCHRAAVCVIIFSFSFWNDYYFKIKYFKRFNTTVIVGLNKNLFETK